MECGDIKHQTNTHLLQCWNVQMMHVVNGVLFSPLLPGFLPVGGFGVMQDLLECAGLAGCEEHYLVRLLACWRKYKRI